MDETGHAGRTVPADRNGTGQPADPAPRAWAQAQPPGHRNGSPWSTVESALEPGADPLSPAWPGASGYAPAGYPDPAGPDPAGADPAGADPAGPDPAAAGAACSWPDWQPVAPSSRHRAYAEEHTPPHGVPAAPPVPPPAGTPTAPPAAPAGESRYAEPYAEPPRGEQVHAEPPQPEPSRAEPPWAEDRYAEPWRPEVLPQRVPAQPDVPALPPGVAEEAGLHAEAPELARIATYLRHDAAPPTRRPFDVDAVLAAVREVEGVRGAELRRNPSGVHTLRLDLVDGVDAGQVSRVVARLLSERMGLSAALGGPPAALGGPPAAAQPTATPPPAVPPSAVPPSAVPVSGVPASAVPAAQPVYEPMRRDSGGGVRGRAAVRPRTAEDHRSASPAGGRAAAGLGQAGGPERASRPLPAPAQGVRVVLDHVQVSTFGLEATVEVRLTLGGRPALGEAHGPAVDGYVLRLCAVSAAKALDQLLADPLTGRARARCFVEHAALVPFGTGEVAVAVVLLVCDGWVEQLAGSALVAGDPRQAVVRATLAAVNRRLESLLH